MGILKIGVVGCGRIGKLHINNLINSVPGVQVVAAADPMLDKSGAREWLAERKITNVSTDFMDVINNPEVDVVFVCSSTDTHCDVSMAAVQAGKHVFCEKPIDYDIDKIKKLLALVEEKGVKFQVGFNRRFDPVSYTHLDVYKRQRNTHLNAPDAGHGVWNGADRRYAEIGLDRQCNADSHDEEAAEVIQQPNTEFRAFHAYFIPF